VIGTLFLAEHKTTTTANMSASAYARSSTSGVNRSASSRGEKKFCGVCHKKGLPESVYTSHFTKSVPGEKGIVTCPTILNAVCTFCRGKGHWADEKFCSAMRAENKRNRYCERRGGEEARRSDRGHKPADSSASLNRYAMLVEEEEVVVPSAAALIPAVAVPKPITTPVAGVSWAAMAGRPAALPKPVEKPLAEGFVVLGPGGGYKPTSERIEYNWEEKEAIARDIFDARMRDLEESEEWPCYDDYGNDDYDEDDENW